jgi:hypothetical protein
MNLIKNAKISMPILYNTETSSTSAAVDMAGYDNVLFILEVGTSGSTAVAMHLESGASSAMTDMIDLEGTSIVSSSTGRSCIASDLIKPPYRYVRPVVVATTESCYSVLAIQYGARKLPVTQSTDVTANETHAVSTGTA